MESAEWEDAETGSPEGSPKGSLQGQIRNENSPAHTHSKKGFRRQSSPAPSDMLKTVAQSQATTTVGPTTVGPTTQNQRHNTPTPSGQAIGSPNNTKKPAITQTPNANSHSSNHPNPSTNTGNQPSLAQTKKRLKVPVNSRIKIEDVLCEGRRILEGVITGYCWVHLKRSSRREKKRAKLLARSNSSASTMSSSSMDSQEEKPKREIQYLHPIFSKLTAIEEW